ncbi:Phosphorylase-like protein 1 [Elsinoe fawcettii]|nr:Phosphorylase-like protein 1 [Elsinoe fawcettii]
MSSSKSELSTVQRSQITVGIICALPCELAAVILMFDRRYSRLTDQAAGDDNIYTCGRIGDHDVAVAQMGSYGLVSAAEVAKALMVTFTSSLKIGLMIGVGGGLPTKSNDIRLGDVVVGKPEGSHGGVFQFDMGRHLQGGKFEHTGHLNRPPEILLKALSTTLANHLLETPTYVEHIRRVRHSMPPHAPWHKPQQDQLFDATVKHNPTEDDCGDCDANKLVERIPRVYEYPRLHAGLIASSNSVVKDAIIRDKLRKETTALCFEMEAAGLMQSFPCLIIRGISDYSDSHKNKAWQPYAALAAAAFGKELLGLVPLTGLREMKNAAEIEALSSEVHSLVESVDQTAASLQQMRLDAEERAQRRETDNSVRAEHAAIRMFHTSTYQESKDLIKPRAPDTCLWALKHTLYEEWINAEAGSLLWISADPGCGKSVLMKTIVEEDLPGRFTTPEELTICYYFFRENSGHAKLHVALCAVLHQIFKTQPIMMRHAKKELQLENTHFLQEPETLFRILDRILGDEAVGPIVCAFDALDECESGDKDRLLSWLCDARRQSGRVKIPVSSRPYEEIERRFRQSSSVSQIRIRGETENEALNREIDQVIHSATMNFASEVELSSEIVSAILRKLLAMRNRTYLWLKLAFEYIKDALRYRKDVAVINMLPSSVADAYEQMLQRRVPEVGRELVDHIFSLMIAADGPLTVWEMQVSLVLLSKKCRTLQEAEAKQFLTMRDVVGSIRKWCGLLVFVQDDRFFFLHQTVKEFLLASHSGTDTSDSNAWFRHISQAHAHATLTRVSIRYIVLEDMPRLFRQQVPVIWRRSQNGVNFRHELQVTELKRELALYWKA